MGTAAPVQLGVSYTPWGDDLTDPATYAAFQGVVSRMQADGVTWVALNVFEFQDTLAATTIGPRLDLWSTPLPSVERAVQEFHARGMKVLLKPNVDVADGSWRGDIAGSNAWFDNPNGYKAFLSRWATWAEAQGVEGLCIGCEFEDAQWNETKWRETIALANGAFSGWLTYAANWTSYTPVGWWDALDYIGIDAYFPLTGVPDPTLAQLTAAWNGRVASIGAWLLSLPPEDRKQVLFTEIGYRSLNGANMAPWQWSPYGPADANGLQEQADCYAAAFAATRDTTWLSGYYWWNWETYPHPTPSEPYLLNDYTPQNKPAELVLAAYYTPEPATSLLLAFGLAALARRRRPRGWPIVGILF